MESPHWSDSLPNDACQEAVTWAKIKNSFAEAWVNCSRGDWMLWLAQKMIGTTRDTPQGVALWLIRADIAELVLPIYENKYPSDTRVRDCIQGVRDYANGKITKEELSIYRQNARAAACAADAADAAWAADASWAATGSAAYAASAADAAADRLLTYAKCADVVRSKLGVDPQTPLGLVAL